MVFFRLCGVSSGSKPLRSSTPFSTNSYVVHMYSFFVLHDRHLHHLHLFCGVIAVSFSPPMKPVQCHHPLHLCPFHRLHHYCTLFFDFFLVRHPYRYHHCYYLLTPHHPYRHRCCRFFLVIHLMRSPTHSVGVGCRTIASQVWIGVVGSDRSSGTVRCELDSESSSKLFV